jgi:hypothetical protein
MSLKNDDYKTTENNRMPNYQNGRIYLIRGGDEVYYGSTTQTLSLRMAQHRSKFRTEKRTEKDGYTSFILFRIYGLENCVIELVELFPCTSCEELTAREAHFIRNNPCVNKVIPGRTLAEYNIEYVRLNKEKIIKYREVNKEIFAERSAKYREANIEQITKRKSEWYQNNKKKISQQRKDAILIVCVCGGKYKRGKTHHEASKKHKDYIANQTVAPPSSPQIES